MIIITQHREKTREKLAHFQFFFVLYTCLETEKALLYSTSDTKHVVVAGHSCTTYKCAKILFDTVKGVKNKGSSY